MDDSAKYLRDLLRKDTTVYTQTEYGRNYWNAYTKVYVARKNKIINITWDVAKVLDTKQKNGRIPYGGFDSVYNLGRRLYPKGHKCDGPQCHSNDHVNGDGRKIHPDGGYRLRQEEL